MKYSRKTVSYFARLYKFVRFPTVDPPQIVQAFAEEVLKAGPAVYLKCVASGNPTPEITWYLDAKKIENGDKYASIRCKIRDPFVARN